MPNFSKPQTTNQYTPNRTVGHGRDDAGGLAARLVVVEDGARAAVGGAEADAQAQHGAANAAAPAALEDAARSVGLDTLDAVAAS